MNLIKKLICVPFFCIFVQSCGGGGDADGEAPPGSTLPPQPTQLVVTATQASGGSVLPLSQNVQNGATATLNITPDEGYTTTSASGCGGTLNGNTYTTAAVTASCTVSASFALKQYLISTSVSAGEGTATPTEQTISHGESAVITLAPASGYGIDSVTGCGGTLVGNQYTVSAVNEGCNVNVTFTPTSSSDNPIIFVTQLPITGRSDFSVITSTFGNHLPHPNRAPRGGSLMIRYPDGTVRDLLDVALKQACNTGSDLCVPGGSLTLDEDGMLLDAFSVRDPVVHWSGNKVLFSMTGGVRHRAFGPFNRTPLWQLYEIEGLGKDATPHISKVENQPAYNNVAAIYSSDEAEIIFTTDRPYNGQAHLYPQLDEYESVATVTGLWKMNRHSGELTLLDHAPSGAFTPILGQDGMVYYTRWDHLQEDQQALNAVGKVLNGREDFWGAKTFSSEAVDATAVKFEDQMRTALRNNDLESAFRPDGTTFMQFHNNHPVWKDTTVQVGNVVGSFEGTTIETAHYSGKYGHESSLRFNLFLPWQISQKGEKHETFRHFGRHEIGHFIRPVFSDDTDMRQNNSVTNFIPDGYFQLTELPNARNQFVGIVAPEFGTHSSGHLLKMTDQRSDGPHEQGSAVKLERLTAPNSQAFRTPIFTTDGRLLASYDEVPLAQKGDDRQTVHFKFRLYQLTQTEGQLYKAGTPLLNSPIGKSFSYWGDTANPEVFDGQLWELSPVEVIARTKPLPTPGTADIPEIERNVFASIGVNIDEFTHFLKQNDLALIISRNITKRDSADKQQPFNLFVQTEQGEGAATNGSDTANRYGVKFLELLQSDMLRGYEKGPGRRGIPMPVSTPLLTTLNHAEQGFGHAVKVASDGSVAAFVPAKRALTWALSDDEHKPVVRERYWLTFAPGEIRVCASCHGVNDVAQDNSGVPVNTPMALQDLLEDWLDYMAANPAAAAK